MSAALYVASASTACSAAFSTYTAADSTSVTAQFASDARWQKLKPVGMSVVDISPPVVWNYQQHVRHDGFFYDGLLPRQSRPHEISTLLPTLNFLPNRRVQAIMPVLGSPVVAIPTPPEQNIQGIGFDGLNFGQVRNALVDVIPKGDDTIRHNLTQDSADKGAVIIAEISAF